MTERIAYQFNGDHVLKFAGMQKLTGEQVADELNRLYTDNAELKKKNTSLEREVEALEIACEHLPIGSQALELAREALAALASPAAELVPREPGYACERNLSGKTVGNRCTACMCEEVKAGPRQGDIEYQIREQAHD